MDDTDDIQRLRDDDEQQRQQINNLIAEVQRLRVVSDAHTDKLDSLTGKLVSKEEFEILLQNSFDRNLANSVRRTVWVILTGILGGIAIWIVNLVTRQN